MAVLVPLALGAVRDKGAVCSRSVLHRYLVVACAVGSTGFSAEPLARLSGHKLDGVIFWAKSKGSPVSPHAGWRAAACRYASGAASPSGFVPLFNSGRSALLPATSAAPSLRIDAPSGPIKPVKASPRPIVLGMRTMSQFWRTRAMPSRKCQLLQ